MERVLSAEKFSFVFASFHISFKYMQNGQTKLHTSGNNNLKEAIYQIYGRDITRELIEIHTKDREETIRIDGFIGKPVISRGNRNFENYYVNGRYVKSKIVTKAVEDAYHTFMMIQFDMPGRNFFAYFLLFTMIFSGGV